jgi:hypothetical protein
VNTGILVNDNKTKISIKDNVQRTSKLAKKKQDKPDFVKIYREQWVNKYSEENGKGMSEEELSTAMEEFEDGIAEARKKQKEYDSIGMSWAKLADNVLIKFEFQDDMRIQECIKKEKRKLGFLLDEEEQAMGEKMKPFQLENLHETREMVENGVEYTCTYRENGGATSTIGTPNKEELAKFIFKICQERGLSSLRPETQIGLFFDSWKNS